jgi:hypothetical protein
MADLGPEADWQLKDIGWLRWTLMRIGLIVNSDPKRAMADLGGMSLPHPISNSAVNHSSSNGTSF